jgi:hypothetical protein
MSKLKKQLNDNYNTYKDVLKTTDERIDFLPTLIKSLYDYLNEQKFIPDMLKDENNITLDKLDNNELIDIDLIQNIALEYIKNKPKDYKHDEYVHLNNELYDYLIKAIIYYYEYYYYQEKINNYKILYPQKEYSKDELINNILINEYIAYDKKTITIENFTFFFNNRNYTYDEIKDEEQPSQYAAKKLSNQKKPQVISKTIIIPMEYYKFYEFIIYKFYNIIKPYNFIEMTKLKEEYIGNFIGNYIEDFTILTTYDDKFINKIKIFINNIKNIYINIIKKGQLIALPQYQGICWFISFLTCICYSDKSKELLINKFDYIETNKNIIDLNELLKKEPNEIQLNKNPEKLFTSLIYYIISNITFDFKRYDDKYKNYCDLYLILKQIPILFLLQLFDTNFDKIKKIYKKYNLDTDNEHINIDKLREIRIENDDLDLIFLTYMYNYHKQKFKKLNDINDYDDNIISSYIENMVLFYKYLYKILKISCVCLVNYNNELYKLDDNDKNDNPDILLIEVLDKVKQFYINNHKNLKNQELLESIGDDTISYNGNNYKLDYILFSASMIEKEGLGYHFTSYIKYNNIEYYYDQRYDLETISCNNKQIFLSCPLQKKNWSKNKDISYFCLNKCYYKIINLNDNISKTTLNGKEGDICYKIGSGYIYGYVKI